MTTTVQAGATSAPVTGQAALAREYRQLLNREGELRAAARAAGALASTAREELAAITGRVREILATPPVGYALPSIAAGLVDHARGHGWLALVQWTPPGYTREPFVTVQVGRLLRESERPDARGDRWTYKVTWHSRGCPPGRVRLFGRGHAVTPDEPAGGDAPSVKAIRAVISAHPGGAA